MNDYKNFENLYDEIKIKKTNSNKTIIVCDRNNFDTTIRGCLASKLIQQFTEIVIEWHLIGVTSC